MGAVCRNKVRAGRPRSQGGSRAPTLAGGSGESETGLFQGRRVRGKEWTA